MFPAQMFSGCTWAESVSRFRWNMLLLASGVFGGPISQRTVVKRQRGRSGLAVVGSQACKAVQRANFSRICLLVHGLWTGCLHQQVTKCPSSWRQCNIQLCRGGWESSEPVLGWHLSCRGSSTNCTYNLHSDCTALGQMTLVGACLSKAPSD